MLTSVNQTHYFAIIMQQKIEFWNNTILSSSAVPSSQPFSSFLKRGDIWNPEQRLKQSNIFPPLEAGLKFTFALSVCSKENLLTKGERV